MLSISHSFPISCVNTSLKYGSLIRPLPYIVLFSVFRLVPQILALHVAKNWRRTTISVRERTSSHKSKNRSYVYLSSETAHGEIYQIKESWTRCRQSGAFTTLIYTPRLVAVGSRKYLGDAEAIYLIVRSQLELILSVLRDFDAMTTARKT